MIPRERPGLGPSGGPVLRAALSQHKQNMNERPPTIAGDRPETNKRTNRRKRFANGANGLSGGTYKYA